MKLAEKRWRVAVQEAERVNKLLAEGYLGVYKFDDLERVFSVPFIIADTRIYQQISPKCQYTWHEWNEEFDNGSHTTIAAIRAQFRGIKFYKPVEDTEMEPKSEAELIVEMEELQSMLEDPTEDPFELAEEITAIKEELEALWDAQY